ncbi:hypothetical protein [Hyphomonas sp.]|uniref:hypothetical protein n=1 Tax=Hyphomonas sp. TaxID=87 RepID=UPI00391A7800
MPSPRSSGNGMFYFIIGAVFAGAVAFGIYYFAEGPGSSDNIEISIGEDGIRIND